MNFKRFVKTQTKAINYHEGNLFFAKDNIYDPAGMELYVQELNERKKKYPQFKHPFL